MAYFESYGTDISIAEHKVHNLECIMLSAYRICTKSEIIVLTDSLKHRN